MLPICMMNEETLAQIPEDARRYLRALRRRLIELEPSDPQQRIAELEAANRGLQVELDDALAKITQQQEQIRHLQQRLADPTAKLNTNSSNSSLPPSSDRFRGKRRPPPPSDPPRKKRGGQPGHPRQQRPLVGPDQVREPTNNEAERTERHGVLLRKTSGGTDSAQGSRFVERILTGVHSCRRQGKKVLDYLSACIESWRHDRDPPSLVPDTA